MLFVVSCITSSDTKGGGVVYFNEVRLGDYPLERIPRVGIRKGSYLYLLCL